MNTCFTTSTLSLQRDDFLHLNTTRQQRYAAGRAAAREAFPIHEFKTEEPKVETQ